MRYLFIIVSICVFGLMSVAVIRGNERHLTATAVAAELVVKEKTEPVPEESIDAGKRRFAIETAAQSFRLSNEIYQADIGTPDAKRLDESIMLLSVDKVKARLDELGVPQMPDSIRAELEPKVMRQYDVGQQIAEKGRADRLAGVLQRFGTEFEVELKISAAAGTKLTREEYYARMLELTDEITEAMESIL